MNYVVQDTSLTAVANAIRTKSGGNSQLVFPSGFVSEIGNIPSGGGWQEWIASQETTNMSTCADALFSGYTRANGHIYVAILLDKPETDFINNQLVGLMTLGANGNNSFIRYRNGSYNYSSGGSNYDGVIEIGDKYLIADISLYS